MIPIINGAEEVEELHNVIKADVRTLAREYLGERYGQVPTHEFIQLKEVFYTEAKYAANIIPTIWECRDIPKLQAASDYLADRVRKQLAK